jgi:nucleoside-diphosphate-sugar epimerase
VNILVIGAAGYLGSHVVEALLGSGHDVTALQRPGGRPVPDRCRAVPGDLADPATVTRAATGFDRVIDVSVRVGEDGGLAAMEALLAAGSPVIYTTGTSVLGATRGDEDRPADEDSPAAPHPAVAGREVLERLVLDAGGWVVRPGLVYGGGGGLVENLMRPMALERRTGVYIGEPGVRWPAVHVADLALLYLAVVERAPAATVWHGVTETIRLDAIAAALGGGSAVSWPLPEATAALGPRAALYAMDQSISAARTRRDLGWTPAHTSLLAYLAT